MEYKMTLIPLTAVHIGTGTTIEPYEYVIADQLHKFDTGRLLSLLDEQDQERLLNYSMTDMSAMRRFIREKVRLITEIEEYAIRVSPKALQTYEERLGNMQSDLSVSPVIRSGSVPFMPGSSVKGAIRTAMLFSQSKKPVRETDARKLEAETFGYARYSEGSYQGFDLTRDPFRHIKVSDSTKVHESTVLRAITVYTKRNERWREDMTMLRETTLSLLADNSQIAFPLRLSLDGTEQKRPNGPDSLGNIVQACNDFYSLHLKEEAKYLSIFPEPASWYEALQDRASNLPESTCIIRLGWGSGFDGMTINYAMSNRETKKSRRFTEDGVPLGWAEIRFETARQ